MVNKKYFQNRINIKRKKKINLQIFKIKIKLINKIKSKSQIKYNNLRV